MHWPISWCVVFNFKLTRIKLRVTPFGHLERRRSKLYYTLQRLSLSTRVCNEKREKKSTGFEKEGTKGRRREFVCVCHFLRRKKGETRHAKRGEKALLWSCFGILIKRKQKPRKRGSFFSSSSRKMNTHTKKDTQPTN